MEDEHELIDRLRALGEQPVEPDVRARTLSRMAEPGPALDATPAPRRWSRPAVAAAALVGFFACSLGLANAGALPAGLQDTAQSVLAHVGIDVPPGHERYNDPTVCPGGPYKNHGEYVRTHKDDPNAGESPCGKPLNAVTHSGNGTDSDESESEGTASESPESESPNKGKGKDKGAQKGKEDGDESSTTTPPTTASPNVTTPPESTSTTTAPTTTAAPTPEPDSASSSS
jgi:hypothetical protein